MKSKPKDVSSENNKHKAYLTKTANFFHTPVCWKAKAKFAQEGIFFTLQLFA